MENSQDAAQEGAIEKQQTMRMTPVVIKRIRALTRYHGVTQTRIAAAAHILFDAHAWGRRHSGTRAPEMSM